MLTLSAARCDKGWKCEAALGCTQTLARFTGALEEATILAISSRLDQSIGVAPCALPRGSPVFLSFPQHAHHWSRYLIFA